MKKIRDIFIAWLPLAFTITVLCGLVYVTVQQNYRMSANDPQIQLSEDYADAIGHGQAIGSVVPPLKVDITKSLGTFVIIFDDKGQPFAGNAILDGLLPTIPNGVFDSVRKHGEDRFTWQPREGVRSAVVVNAFHGQQEGYFLVGRSLNETEKRESQLTLYVLAAWVTALVGSFILKAYSRW